MASTHTVESTTGTVRSGYLDPAAEPVATIAPGGYGALSEYLDPRGKRGEVRHELR
jgi:hypothetical protein